ncbi:MAG: hypothetical protein LBS92_00225 [Candidatus Methanoplasma sp.]|nr:hypothetical protein [Candidatus Methanoplasma sp.]
MILAVFSIALLAASAVQISPDTSDAAAGKVTVNLNVSPDGAGKVTGRGEYDLGAYVRITAEAYEGYEFISWQDGIRDNPRYLSLPSSSKTVEYTAEFKAIPKYMVDLRVKGNVGGSTMILCDGKVYEGSVEFYEGATVVLRAVAHQEYKFVKWSDGDKNWEKTVNELKGPVIYTAEFELINKPVDSGGLGMSFIWVILGLFGATAVISYVYFEIADRKKKRNQER